MITEVNYSLSQLLSYTEGFHRTSTIENLRDNSTVCVKSEYWLWALERKLLESKKNVVALCSANLATLEVSPEFAKRARPIFMWDVTEKFILFHNEVNQHRQPMPNEFAVDCRIHPTAVIGVSGMRYIRTDRGPVSMDHMGNVVIGSRVKIDPYTVVHRATIDSTVIGKWTKIGTNCNIGHNVVIGRECFITPHVCIGGSAKIGNGCFIAMNATIRNHARICGRVKIGMGSQVVKDITETGLYYGVPAERKGDWNGKF